MRKSRSEGTSRAQIAQSNASSQTSSPQITGVMMSETKQEGPAIPGNFQGHVSHAAPPPHILRESNRFNKRVNEAVRRAINKERRKKYGRPYAATTGTTQPSPAYVMPPMPTPPAVYVIPASTPTYPVGYAAPGYAAPGYSTPGYALPGYVPPGYAPPGYAPPGYAPPGYAPSG